MKKQFYILFIGIFIWEWSFSQPYFDTVQLRKSISYMADDDKAGRFPGTSESAVVADFIRDVFKNAGLTLVCDDGFQPFNYTKGWKLGDSNFAEINGKPLMYDTDFVAVDYFQTRKASLSAPIVFIGYGNINNAKQIDDYAHMDIVGKWVMILGGTDSLNPLSTDINKVHKAFNQGAGGVILVDTSKTLASEIKNVLRIKSATTTEIGPIIKINEQVANLLLAANETTIDELKSTIRQGNREPFVLQTPFSATTHFVPVQIAAKNVVAVLEGSDPNLKNEYIVIGGHYDHVGTKERIRKKDNKPYTYIYNGADDNASGTTGVLELAKKYASLPQRPKRSLLFVAFDAEEEGLLGSANFFTENLPIRKDQIKAMVNLDMIGRYDPEKGLKVLGARTSKEGLSLLKKITKKANITVNFPKSNMLFMGSDHLNFYKHNIPVFFFNTDMHKDYHKTSDDTEKINVADMQEVLHIVDILVEKLANQKKNLTFMELE